MNVWGVFVCVFVVAVCNTHTAVAFRAPTAGLKVEHGVPLSVRPFYHKTDDLLLELSSLECDCLKKEEIVKDNYKATVFTLGHNNNSNKKHRLFVTFCMHGREYITAETARHLILTACGKTTSSTFDSKQIKDILSTTTIKLIPVVNVVGRKRVETGDLCAKQRKNANNVDINRNFKNFWGQEDNSNPDSEIYPGPSPMSEPETQVIDQIATDFKPHGFLDVHAGEVGMSWVYAHTKDSLAENESDLRAVTKSVNDEVFDGKIWIGRTSVMGGAQAYNSYGASNDYMYLTKKVKYSAIWEIYAAPYNSAAKVSEAAAAQPGAQPAIAPTQPILNAIQPNPSASAGTNALQPETIASSLQPNALTDTNSKLASTLSATSQQGSEDSCFEYFNPMTEAKRDWTVAKWADAVLSLAKHLPDKF